MNALLPSIVCILSAATIASSENQECFCSACNIKIELPMRKLCLNVFSPVNISLGKILLPVDLAIFSVQSQHVCIQ
jgi:hypothetical protein